VELVGNATVTLLLEASYEAVGNGFVTFTPPPSVSNLYPSFGDVRGGTRADHESTYDEGCGRP